MTLARILSRQGNVIAADFRPHADPKHITVSLSCKTEVLYEDAHIMVTRTTVLVDGRAASALHLAGDKTTGNIVQF